MKILIDAHSAIEKRTGIGRYVDNLITNMTQKKGVEISIYSNLKEKKLKSKYKNLPHSIAPFKNGFYRVFVGLNLASLKLKPELMHVNFFAPIIKTRPTVVTVHDICFKTHPQFTELKNKLTFKFFFERSLRLADAVICVSENTKNKLIKNYTVDPEKITVIYEGVDNNFRAVSNLESVKIKLKKRFGISKNYFLIVGNIQERKKPLETISAFRKTKNDNTELIFAGPNLLKGKLWKKFKNEKKSGGIKEVSFVNDKELNLLYNGASALIYNSHCEGFGLSILEAMACKTPVLASEIPVFREVGGNAAIYFKTQKELARSMDKILTNDDLRKKYSRLGLERSKNFTWRKTAEETLKVYEKVLEYKNI